MTCCGIGMHCERQLPWPRQANARAAALRPFPAHSLKTLPPRATHFANATHPQMWASYSGRAAAPGDEAWRPRAEPLPTRVGVHEAAPQRLVAIGDMHGDYDKALRVLSMAGLIDASGRWSGGQTVAVQVGDAFACVVQPSWAAPGAVPHHCQPQAAAT
jgi:hypothetical protein